MKVIVAAKTDLKMKFEINYVSTQLPNCPTSAVCEQMMPEFSFLTKTSPSATTTKNPDYHLIIIFL